MAENKKYFYLKLKENFFDRPEMKAIESFENGYEYICIILKMYLKSLEREGRLVMTDTIPYDLTILSAVLGHKQDTVKFAVDLFLKFGLCELLEDKTIYMTEIQNFIGRSTTEADRKREYRSTISSHKELLKNKNGTFVGHLSDIYPPKKELNLKLKLDPEKKTKKEVKHRHGEYSHVLLTDKQFKDLTEKFGSVLLTSAIKILDEGIEEKGYKYKNHNLTIQKWPIKEARLAHQKKNGDPWE